MKDCMVDICNSAVPETTEPPIITSPPAPDEPGEDGEDGDKEVTTPPVPAGPVGTCRIYGDPHVLTFDGQHASFYSQGEYWIVKSTTVWIQGRYLPTPVTNGLSVTKELAIGGPFLNGHKLRISALSASWDGQPILGSFPDKWSNENPAVSIVTDSNGEILQQGRAGKPLHVVHVNLPLGVSLQINRWNEAGEGDYINTKLMMPAAPQQDGHCGNFNGNPGDDTRPQIRARVGTTGVQPQNLLFNTKTPVKAPNRPDLNDCPPDKTNEAKSLCQAKSPNGIPTKECMIDVCFGGPQFADEDAENYLGAHGPIQSRISLARLGPCAQQNEVPSPAWQRYIPAFEADFLLILSRTSGDNNN